MNYSIFYSKFKGAALLSYSKFKVQLLFVIIYFTLEKKKRSTVALYKHCSVCMSI